jgi:hypothetical protein
MKIAIVGCKPDTWEKVPLLGPEWEIWRFSRRTFEKPPKAHRWFEIHHPRNYPRYAASKPGYLEFLRETGAITFHNFPWDALLREFGPYFFSGGQMPWIMAYAITCNPETIGIWGVDPIGDYKPQRSEVQHFVQIARDRGIEVIAPEEKILEPRRLYGLDKDIGHQEQLEQIMSPEGLRSALHGDGGPSLDECLKKLGLAQVPSELTITVPAQSP